MKGAVALTGGLAGAVTLTLAHELVKKYDPKAPRLDLLGMNALSKSLRQIGVTPPERSNLYYLTLAGDLLSNSYYYSLIIRGKKRNRLIRGLVLGAGAGIGALVLPKKLNLNAKYVKRTTRTALITVGIYVLGGLVAASVSSLIDKKRLW